LGEGKKGRPFWYLRRSPESLASEVDEELAGHLERRVAELVEGGMAPDAARKEALRQFGDLSFTRRYCRDQRVEGESRRQRSLLVHDLIQDVRTSLRGLVRVPLLAVAIVTTVGLGVGATTVVFAAVDAVLLRPLPYASPGALVRIYTDSPPFKFRFSLADYLALQDQQTRFQEIAAYADSTFAFSEGNVAERVRGREVSCTYFRLLGLKPFLGRDFGEADCRPGSPRSVILSYGFWQRRLGGRASVPREALLFDGQPVEIAGVLPQEVGPLERRREFFIAGQWAAPPRRGPFLYSVLGRLKGDAGAGIASEELRAINRRIFPLWRSSYQDEKATWGMMDLKAYVAGDLGTVSSLALLAVGLVWLIACTNASNLLIARVVSRRRELAVRAALGASRGRVFWHLLAESLLLAGASGLLGGAIASFGTRAFRTLGAGSLPRAEEITLEGAPILLLFALIGVTAVVFTLVPTVHGTGGPVEAALRTTGRSTTGGLSAARLRRLLVATEFAIATPLLVAAGLLLSSLQSLARVDLGFSSENLLTGSITLPASEYKDSASVSAFWEELESRAVALSGVEGVAYADGRPPNDVPNFDNFDLEEHPTPPGASQPVTPWVAVSPGYFRLLGLGLLEGRTFDDRGSSQMPVVVVDEAWARRFFPGESVLGKRFHEGGCTNCPWMSVVGVVSGVKYAGLDKPDEGTVYTPLAVRGAPSPERTRYLFLRTGGPPGVALGALRGVLREIDASIPLAEAATIDDLVSRSLEQPRSLTALVGVFAGIALLLSIVGVYGVMAYYVQQHLRDLSIRLALGGSPGAVLGLLIGQGMSVVAAGIGVGLLGALVLARFMAGLLFGIGAADARTLLAVGTLLLAAALLACAVPAARALRLEPAVLLREE
jgi:predicted permease